VILTFSFIPCLFINAALFDFFVYTTFRFNYQGVAEIQDAYQLSPLAFHSPAPFAVALLASGQNSTLTGIL